MNRSLIYWNVEEIDRNIVLITFMIDRVVLGISQSKAFYIVTDKKDEVRQFLLSITDGGVTLINARGGFSNNKETLLLGVVPTRQYFIVKEGLREIDNNKSKNTLNNN